MVTSENFANGTMNPYPYPSEYWTTPNTYKLLLPQSQIKCPQSKWHTVLGIKLIKHLFIAKCQFYPNKTRNCI